ncbi:MAG: alpha/beta hydrolase [Cyclonatronaceae bacterium]
MQKSASNTTRKEGQDYDPDLMPLIDIISEAFEIPQLIKTRRITALLPYDYYETERRYPVLYLQDGQNLFDDFAPFGSWELRRQLARLAERNLGDVIVVAIDHAEEERIAEFTPSQKTKLGVGDGKKYARFLAETLKPWIDLNYRTFPDSEHTGIGGSSMGGLISIYAVMQHPELYSRLMIFSPSLWVSPSLTELFNRETRGFSGRIYLYGGRREGEELIMLLKSFKNNLDRNPDRDLIEVELNISNHGEHNEKAWGHEFPRALEWLYFRK